MLKKHILSGLRENLGYQPTDCQSRLMDFLADFILNPESRNVLLVKGYAGTGKTSIVSALVRTLETFRLKSVLMAPTGRAAKVFASFAGKTAYTIHKKIYRQKSSRDGFGKFILEKNLHSQTIFMVDEASMISNKSSEISMFGSGRLLDDLITYVYNDKACKLILIGDTAQLPPVGFEVSPALNKRVLEGFGLGVTEIFLDEIVRQSQGSGILVNATSLRNQLKRKDFHFPRMCMKSYSDIKRIKGEDLLEEITTTYDRLGMENTIVVVRSNKMANKYNAGIRNLILWRENEISVGDYIMVVKNNYYWGSTDETIDFIANGDIAEICRVRDYQERYGFRFADVLIRFPDYHDIEIETKVLLDTITLEAPSLSEEDSRKLYNAVAEDYPDAKSKKQQFDLIRNDPFFNALQVKFAYAVTCHKAQGGQWPAVFIDQGYIHEDRIDIEYLRWLYTAVTRATEKLFLVNFRDDFFEDVES
ncbi:MAG: AAA family ATPase [Bacteroidales bacterium]|nr:MAG: AAA family ATPase [Bacteroidales bacterium]